MSIVVYTSLLVYSLSRKVALLAIKHYAYNTAIF
jgi:hypothetical protein